MSKYPQINFRPSELDLLILEKMHSDLGLCSRDGKPFTQSDLVRFCIQFTGEKLFDSREYGELLLLASRK
jgi:hypothetical protein